MKTERELFEAHLLRTDKFKFRNKTFLFMLDDSGEYEDQPVLEHWETWQASVQREGFVLVPVEPTQIMCDEGFSELNTYNRDDTPYGVIKNIYQSMIEATK